MMVDIELAALIGAMGWTAVSFMKHIRAGALYDALTLAVVVGVGIGVAFLVQAAGQALQGQNAASVVIAGYAGSSAIRVVYEIKKALDGNDSAKEPKLVPPSG
jgi:hypothetical protein